MKTYICNCCNIEYLSKNKSKFCSNKCAATVNNKLFPKKKMQAYTCTKCMLEFKPVGRTDSRYLCRACKAQKVNTVSSKPEIYKKQKYKSYNLHDVQSLFPSIDLKSLSKRRIGILIASARGMYVDVTGEVFHADGRKVHTWLSKSGYHHFDVGFSVVAVHQLQAYAKYGVLAFSADCTRHLNGIKADNSWDNICIGSNSENRMDIPLQKRKFDSKTANIKRRKFTEAQIEEIRLAHTSGETGKSLALRFGCSQGTMSFILRGTTYKK